MEQKPSGINLFKQDLRSPLSDILDPVALQFRNLSILAIFVVLIGAIATFAIYMTVQGRHQIVKLTKSKYEKMLAAEKQKESIFLVIKSRIDIVDRVVSSLKNFHTPVENALTISSPPKLVSISVDDTDNVIVSIKPDTLEDAIAMTASILTLSAENKIKKTRMNSFKTDTKGTTISFSFMPIWEGINL